MHWNFFFTLGLIPFVVALQKKIVPLLRFEGAAFSILLCYMLALHFGGLEEYILEAPRTNWFNMNREGIFSFAGYYSLFLLAASLGNELLSLGRDSAKLQRPVLQRLSTYLLFSAVMLSVLVFGYDLQVSRRLVSLYLRHLHPVLKIISGKCVIRPVDSLCCFVPALGYHVG